MSIFFVIVKQRQHHVCICVVALVVVLCVYWLLTRHPSVFFPHTHENAPERPFEILGIFLAFVKIWISRA